jgi:hypothetical protein
MPALTTLTGVPSAQGSESPGQEIGPAAVRVRVRARAIGDRVAERDDRLRGTGGEDLDLRDEQHLGRGPRPGAGGVGIVLDEVKSPVFDR